MRRTLERATAGLAIALFSSHFVACASRGEGARAIVVPDRDAHGPAPKRPVIAGSAIVQVSYFGEEGAYLGPFYDPVPDAAKLVAPCADEAKAEGDVVGWILFDVAVAHDAPAKIARRDSSPLPAAFVACVETALAALRPREAGFVPPPTTAYVTVR